MNVTAVAGSEVSLKDAGGDIELGTAHDQYN